ncbi:ubiquinone biosynthesis hydrox [Dendrothele bispora CBS 962.96]|uniref:Ubiquinone biosynthesis monooxygenase COQ6, mitochondrial n=1 Tax=Dendrothele bispora (strain CBS 962.96) TaxID=1314807 RepID=A0A4S8M648_DENBC|nr:ubiquinone biosynthesis hydrox [Dendrothele bispora CBS 962.96]
MLSSKSSRFAINSCRNSSRRVLTRKYFSTTHEECDVVIVGGGPAGLALASALGSKHSLRESLKVALVEAGDLSKVQNWVPADGTYSNRVVSLTNASQAFLNDIGSWSHIEMDRTAPIEEMQVWDGISDARIEFSAAEMSLSNPGQGMARLTEVLNLQRALLRHLELMPHVEVIDKTKVMGISPESVDGGWPLVQLENGRVLRSRLLVGADGLNSPVRSFAKIPTYGWAYDTHAIVATMFHSAKNPYHGPNTTAFQRFLPTGPIAFLPLSSTASSLVWSTKPDLAAALKNVEPSVLARMINAAFRLPEVSMRYLHDRIREAHQAGTPITDAEIKSEIQWREQSHSIGSNSAYSSAPFDMSEELLGIPPDGSELLPSLVTSIQPGTVASFPLRYNHTETYIGEGEGSRTVLVGDAAHTIHPLAGQGLNLGLGDVECLARVIQSAVLRGGDIGSYTSLLPYSRERYLENHKIMSACDKLHKLYSMSFGPVVSARSVGLEVLNEFDSIKAAFMMTAGSSPRVQRENGSLGGDLRSTAFNVAAKGVEGLTATAGVVQAMRGGLAGLAVNGLHSLLTAISSSQVKK